MKILKISFIALIVFVPLFAIAQEQSTAPVRGSGARTRLPWENKTGLERHKMLSVIQGSRKITVKPITQSEGINTGLVVAYGHVIPAPYKVEYLDNKLIINGVQVQPSLVREREDSSKKKNHPQVSATGKRDAWKGAKIDDTAQELYRNGLKTKSLENVHQEIIEYIKKSTDVYENPVWTGKNSLKVQLVGSHIQGFIQFSDKQRANVNSDELDKQAKERVNKVQELSVASIKRSLNNNGTLVFFSDGGQFNGAEDIRKSVNQIMENKALNRDERIEKLKDSIFSGDYEPAIDVVDNYGAAEWQMSK